MSDPRPLYLRAKFIGPVWCSVAAIGVFFAAVWNIEDLDGAQLQALVTVTTSTITALMTLGIIIGGGASLHDASRDWGQKSSGIPK